MLSHIRFLEGYIYYCFPGGAVVKNPPASAGDARDAGSIPGLGKSSGEGNGVPLQYSCLENPMNQRSLAGYNHKDSDTTEQPSTQA